MAKTICNHCGGGGQLWQNCPAHTGKNCGACGGSGQIVITCPTCKGTGR